MDRTDAKPLQSSRSSSSVKQKYTVEETKLKNTNFPVQESLSVQESEAASGLSSLGNSDSNISLRSLNAGNSMGSMSDSGFSRLVVELCFFYFYVPLCL